MAAQTAVVRVQNPFSLETYEVPAATREQVHSKFQKASQVQRKWATVAVADRIAVVSKLCELLAEEKNAQELAVLVAEETGRPVGFSRFLFSIIPDRLKYFSTQAETALNSQSQPCELPGVELSVQYEARGVIGHISAWNFPVLMACDFLVPCLLCGNGSVYKPSEFCPRTAIRLVQLFLEAGVPSDLIGLCVGDGTVGKWVCDLPVHTLLFIGSHPVGCSISSALSPRLVPVQLELGGKDAFLVWSDADVAMSARVLCDGAFEHSGQNCNAVDRVFVHHAVYDQFVELFVKHTQSFVYGDPQDEKTTHGPMTRGEVHLQLLQSQVDDAVQKGAKLLCGGKRLANTKGFFFPATVLGDVTADMEVMTKETFGPVKGIMRLPEDCTLDKAVEMMNDTTFGLTGGVFTKDKTVADRVIRDLCVGSAYWNCCGLNEACMPWSGRKKSGMGRILSGDFAHQFLQTKSVYRSATGFPPPE